MSKELKIEDFEVVPDIDGKNGCSKCFFNQADPGCTVMNTAIGIDLEKKHGLCFESPEHYFIKKK